ncbi:pseudouridine synthase [Pseudohoeflea suaedae]|uniref:Pseudouridine synthase n=1 Tax=Pseudohoeflea suaedae TaxID=877384 RepID=A0A4R5PN60_9HYPH|nr:pseudouridine synthase [Pseudohoeflea suaedae]
MTNEDKPARGKRPRREDTDRKGKQPSSPARKKAGPQTTDTAADGNAVETGRIAKILARAGVASRRDAERMVTDGRVKVNGKLLESPAIVVSTSDKIEVDDKLIAAIERTRLWIYHKPAGLVTTNRDPEGRTTIFERMPAELPRVVTVGRLDINTEGLLLLTNDGGLARQLELPSTGWLRRYRVRAHGEIDQPALDKLQDGIAVDGVLYGAIEATLDRQQGRNVWITMGLREGKNREIKNVLGALGLEVNRLIRISYGPFQLGDLPEGDVVEVRSKTLRDQLGQKVIEEAGLNFEAPIIDHKQEQKKAESEAEKPRKPEREWISASERRERARDRLDTKPGKFGDKPGKFGDRGGERGKPAGGKDEKRRPAPPRSRSANVWMAPGARPLGEKKQAAAAERAERRDRDASAGKSVGRGKPAGDKPRFSKSDDGRSGEGRPARKDGGFGKGRPAGRADGKPNGKPGFGGSGKPSGKPGGKSSGDRSGRGPDRGPDRGSDRGPASGPARGPKGRGGPGADRRR